MNLQAGLAFSLSLFLGFLVFFMINFLMGMVSIVTLNISNISWAYMTLVMFTSGQMVPLWMFPRALAAIIEVLPFKDIYYIPMSIYIGAYDGSIGEALLSQTAWIIALFIAARLVWGRMQLRITVQGG
jgi:ABC-2 type transport system permease protein